MSDTEIIVENKRTYKGPGEYIGRPSLLGNPFSHIKGKTLAKYLVNSRDESIERYGPWAREQIASDPNFRGEFFRLVRKYQSEGFLILICWCKPLSCHGDILAEMIKETAGEGNLAIK